MNAVRVDGVIRLTCTCKAGSIGDICKHRLALLAGDGTAAVDGAAMGAFIAEMVGSPIMDAFAALGAAEDAAARAKKNVTSAKAVLARAMRGISA